MPAGFSFQPGQDAMGGMQDTPMSQPGSAASTPQQAVKVLSLRVPKALPSNAPVNRSLLMGPGSSAPGAGGLQSMIAALLRAFQPQPESGAPEQPSAQPPQQPSRSLPTFPSAAPQPTSAPSFEGIFDTPPMQNAPPFLLPDPGLQRDQRDPIDHVMAGSYRPDPFFDPAPHTPSKGWMPHWTVDRDPTRGGGSGQNA